MARFWTCDPINQSTLVTAKLFVVAIAVAEAPAQCEANAPTSATEVRFVHTQPEGETSEGMEAWILKKLSKKGEVLVSMSECVTLSSENQRFCEANGMYIDGKAKKRDGNFIVKLSGCSGIELKRTATIKPGEQAVYLVKGRRRIFGAIRPETL